MGKNKKKPAKAPAASPAPEGSAAEAAPSVPAASAPEPAAPDAPVAAAAEAPAPAPGRAAPAPQSRLRRVLPDLVKTALALLVIALAALIWIQPPLIRASRPAVTYRFAGQEHADATLYRPLALPTRYYVELPRALADRYTWFAVDRRREVAALAEAPRHRLFGRPAIRRGDPLGLDLEFRKLDHSEWQVHFLPEAIVFSNAVLSLRLDARPAPAGTR